MTGQTHMDGYVKWLRARVGHRLIYLVYTIGLVFDGAGRLLVQTRYDFDWLSVPGGIYEPHETLTQTVRREVQEETGVTCQVTDFIGVFSHPDDTLHYPNGDVVQPWTAAFVCQATDTRITVDGQETLHAAFQPPADVYDRLPPMYQVALDAVGSGQLPVVEPVYHGPEHQSYLALLREHVGAARVIVPEVRAALFDSTGQVLVVRDPTRDAWTLPGGLSNLGETTSGTFQRTVQTQTGLHVQPGTVAGLYSDPALTVTIRPNGEALQTVTLLLSANAPDDLPGNLSPTARWQPIDSLLAQEKLPPLTRQLLRDLQRRATWPVMR